MGHYDDVRYMEEARRDGYTKEELEALEKEVKEKGKINVYDDYDGMKKVMMARDSYTLVSNSSGTMFTIEYDSDKLKRHTKELLNKKLNDPKILKRIRKRARDNNVPHIS